jgi:CubicO group peptidase (beta-lactamase class C family)
MEEDVRMFGSVCLAVLSLLALSQGLLSQTPSEAIDAYLQSMNAAGKFNGCALVTVGEETLLSKGYGYANLEWRVPNGPDTKFNIGSISKQFTTVLVFQLARDGLLKLDDPISKYLPNYRADTGRKVTIDHLLRHTSGIPCYLRDYRRKAEDDLLFPFPAERHFAEDVLVSQYMSGDLLFEPGSAYQYTNSGFYLLHMIIEKVTGKTLEKNLQERILIPLGLKNTGLLDNFKVVERLSCGYVQTPIGMIKAEDRYEPNYYGAGAMYATAGDLLAWNRALHSGAFLPAETREKMLAPYWKEGGYVQHAYSLDSYTMRVAGKPEPVAYTSFNGAIQGFVSDAIRFENDGLTIVLLDNSDQFNHTRIAGDIYRLLMKQKVEPPKPALSRYIAEIAIDKGIDQAVREYYGILDKGSDRYDVNPLSGSLGWYAFILADAGKNDEALTLLNLRRTLYPHSTEVWGDLADFLDHIKSPEAARTREQANEAKLSEQKLYDHLSKSEFEKALQAVEELKSRSPRPDVFESQKIGPIFGALLGQGRTDAALHVCRIWAKGNSADVGPYFSMARIYETLGRTEELKNCYRKILEIARNESQKQRAREKLRELEAKK